MWNVERAAPRSSIWPCTRWGFPCLRACAWSGGLLPHLFTLTPTSLPKPGRFNFLWHCPSGRLAASPPACISPPAFLRRPGQLRGIAPFGVRTFLLPRIASGKAILRPSKITPNICLGRRDDKRFPMRGLTQRKRAEVQTEERNSLGANGMRSRMGAAMATICAGLRDGRGNGLRTTQKRRR